MIDIHCHILPGIDDGPSDFSKALEMARIAEQDGINTIVATPHVGSGFLKPEEINSLAAEMTVRVNEVGLHLAFVPGADVNVIIDPGLFNSYTIAKTQYILIEFPHSHLPGNARETVFRLVSEGLRPIVTHPERNGSIIKDPMMVEMLIESGGLVQITAGSLTGEFGPEIRECSKYLLKKDFVHFLATDAHSPTWRPPVLSEAVKVAEKLIGKDKAHTLVKENPETVLSGGAIHV